MSDTWRTLFPKAERNRADFLLDGAAYFESLVKAIEAASGSDHYVYILGWMLDVDFPLVATDKSKTLFNVLKDAAGRNVEVRILVWENLIPEYFKMMNQSIPRLNKLPNTRAFADEHTFYPKAPAEFLRKFSPYLRKTLMKIGDVLGDFRPEAAIQFSEFIEVKDISVQHFIYRLLFFLARPGFGAHHEKVVIVKNSTGLIAYSGGMDINKNRVASTINKKDYPYPTIHDATCRLEGPAAHEVLERFKRRWRNHATASRDSLRGANEPKPRARQDPYPYATAVGTYNSPDGQEKDRSGRDAFMKIVENAKTYIYIEDQYLVNLDVAKALNKKIKEKGFQTLIFAIQDSIATSDIFIPNRKRGDFLTAVLDGTSPVEKDKVLMAVIDRSRSEQDQYHPGMHAKTLIVDDEIAMIGSTNVNLRSFTNDSETSIVVYDDAKTPDNNFARVFRIAIWKEFLRRPVPRIMYESTYNYPSTIKSGEKGFSILVKYERDNLDDTDVRISDAIKSAGVVGAIVAGELTGGDIGLTSQALSPASVTRIFDLVWENLIEPNAG